LNLERLNRLPEDQAEAAFLACCGSREWARRMAISRPFWGLDDLLVNSDLIWWSLGREDWLEAFAAHPQIGDKAPEKPAEAGGEQARQWSASEQKGTRGVAPEILDKLAKGNRAYHNKFGYIFIVCATGKGARQMLDILRERFVNDPETELRVAADEQRKITNLRLRKMVKR
jgi:OHCU decarboxylase